MSRNRRKADLKRASFYVDEVMRLGYYVVEFSPYHIRIQDAVDFWPTSLKWRSPKGYNFDKEGVGMASLKSYLTKYHPLEQSA